MECSVMHTFIIVRIVSWCESWKLNINVFAQSFPCRPDVRWYDLPKWLPWSESKSGWETEIDTVCLCWRLKTMFICLFIHSTWKLKSKRAKQVIQIYRYVFNWTPYPRKHTRARIFTGPHTYTLALAPISVLVSINSNSHPKLMVLQALPRFVECHVWLFQEAWSKFNTFNLKTKFDDARYLSLSLSFSPIIVHSIWYNAEIVRILFSTNKTDSGKVLQWVTGGKSLFRSI